MPRQISKLNGSAKDVLSWLNAGMGHVEAIAKLKAEHGIEVSQGWFSKWFKKQRLKEARKGIGDVCAFQIQRAEEVRATFAKTVAPDLQEICKPLKISAINLAERGMTDTRALHDCLDVVRVLIDLHKCERATCEHFMRWANDRTAEMILSSDAPNQDKIERLHLLMFGEPLERLQEVMDA